MATPDRVESRPNLKGFRLFAYLNVLATYTVSFDCIPDTGGISLCQ